MRIVIQRVSKASVKVESSVKSKMKQGLLILLGIELEDNIQDVLWLTKKISSLRIFSGSSGKMNRSVKDIDGDIMVISQFTLHAKTKKGNRPSYTRSASPDQAIVLYERFKLELSAHIEKKVFSGSFGAHMQVELLNDGPVTIIIDSKNKE